MGDAQWAIENGFLAPEWECIYLCLLTSASGETDLRCC